jgi:FO synthase
MGNLNRTAHGQNMSRPTAAPSSMGRNCSSDMRHHILGASLHELIAEARGMRNAGHGTLQSFSPKVFIPLTKLCRDYCHYCTFSRSQERDARAYMTPEQVLDIARKGQALGCTEALFTLGDKPELRYEAARRELVKMGYASTLAYLIAMCGTVLRETGLLPHVNAGVMGRDDLLALRAVSASQGLMLETAANRLCAPGEVHYRSPDKVPAVRLDMIGLAGELRIPFTSGILIGIGETREERLDALFALRNLHDTHGHIQEIIIQNFRAKLRTPMEDYSEPEMDDLLWTIAAARVIFGKDMNVQAPPNLSHADFPMLLEAGINDWGGVSPLTPDHVNPEAPWPERDILESGTLHAGYRLIERLPVYPAYVRRGAHWIDEAVLPSVLRASDAEGWARDDRWSAGGGGEPAPAVSSSPRQVGIDAKVAHALDALGDGTSPDIAMIETLFSARGDDVERVCEAADTLRRKVCGDRVSYVVNRNINYTNICGFACGFCAFSKGPTHADLRGKPYDLDHVEIARRVAEAVARGASEVCLQGGIHPQYSGLTYLSILKTVKSAAPDIHVHAFSPLEIMHGAQTLKISVRDFLVELKAAGLGTLPGTAAEILDDEVRAIICPDKLTAAEWLFVVGTAHEIGLKTTATIMFGHIDRPVHWARHLLAIRDLQARTGGITEFVPLPFVHMEAPLSRKGRTRRGPTFREVRLMHAVARLALHPVIRNVQVSWTKLGPQGARIILGGGANDLGGTLMNESISRAAGSMHGQEFSPAKMEALIRSLGRVPAPRTTLYAAADPEAITRAYSAAPLTPMQFNPPVKVRKLAELHE